MNFPSSRISAQFSHTLVASQAVAPCVLPVCPQLKSMIHRFSSEMIYRHSECEMVYRNHMAYLDVQRVVAFTVKVTLTMPKWLGIQWDQSPINEQPAILPCLTQVCVDPLLGLFFLTSCDWGHHCTHELLIQNCDHDSTCHQDDCTLPISRPCGNLAQANTISEVTKPVQSDSKLVLNRYSIGVCSFLVEFVKTGWEAMIEGMWSKV